MFEKAKSFVTSKEFTETVEFVAKIAAIIIVVAIINVGVRETDAAITHLIHPDTKPE